LTLTKIEQKNAVISLYFDVRSGWQQYFLLRSDVHHDSIACAVDLEREHLEEAKRLNAYVLDFGDLFDAMQGRFDPRRSMDELAEKYRRDDYYDYVVQDLAEFYAPYAEQLLMLGHGNHETNVRRHSNTDLTDRLVYLLRTRYKSPVMSGGYGGWIRFMFNFRGGVGGATGSYRLKYFHGSGGEAPVTRGAIQTNRQAVYLPDADIVVNGHSHNAYWIPITRERLSQRGVQYFDLQHHVRIPGYKQGYGDGSGGFEVERGGAPKPVGAVLMKMTARCANEVDYIEIEFEPRISGPSAGIGQVDVHSYTERFYSDDPEGE